MTNGSNKIKHLEMIAAIIERMAKNSFQLKGWAMTLVAAMIALSAKDANQKFILFAFIPVVSFWGLDAFYLQQERKYRQLYKNVSEKDEANIDFNLDTRETTGSAQEMSRLCYCKCILSPSVWLFYGAIIVAMIILMYVLRIFG